MAIPMPIATGHDIIALNQRRRAPTAPRALLGTRIHITWSSAGLAPGFSRIGELGTRSMKLSRLIWSLRRSSSPVQRLPPTAVQFPSVHRMAAICAAAVRSAGQQDERDNQGAQQGQAVIIVVEDEVLIRNDDEAEYLEQGHAPKSATIPARRSAGQRQCLSSRSAGGAPPGACHLPASVLLERAGPRRHFASLEVPDLFTKEWRRCFRPWAPAEARCPSTNPTNTERTT